MENDSPILFVEINKSEIIFIVSQKMIVKIMKYHLRIGLLMKILSTLLIQTII